MTAGYSGTPLARKLGIKPGHRVLTLNVPDNYAALVAPLPEGVILEESATGPADIVHFFTVARADLERRLNDLKAAIPKDGAIWVSWPRKSSEVPTDVTGSVVRDVALAAGLVDVKICAIDATWSGLKLVYRLKDRK